MKELLLLIIACALFPPLLGIIATLAVLWIIVAILFCLYNS